MIRNLLLAIVLFSSTVFAQTAALHGQVTDESGALVPGAKVILSGPARPARTAIADDRCSYSFAGLPPETYSVQASAPQLVQAQAVKITLGPGEQVLNLTLKVASQSPRK